MDRPELISIIGGGCSFREVNPERIPGLIVGVNDSAILIPRCDVVVSMDRLWIEHRWERVKALATETHFRVGAAKRLARPLPDWCHLFECDHTSAEMSDEPGRLNGENSGYCALSYAYQRRPRQILLFGFDMMPGPQGEPYWYKRYPWVKPGKSTNRGKFPNWALSFARAAQAFKRAEIECRIIGASRIRAFPQSPAKEFA